MTQREQLIEFVARPSFRRGSFGLPFRFEGRAIDPGKL